LVARHFSDLEKTKSDVYNLITIPAASQAGELKRKIDSLGEIFTKITAIITKTT